MMPLTLIGADAVDQRLGNRLAGVVGIDALNETLVDCRRRGFAAGDLDAVRAPDQPEARVADAVGALARSALLMVVEVPGLGIRAPADVDAHIGRGLRRLVARADDFDAVAVRKAQRRDREDVVGVEVAGMRRDPHQAGALLLVHSALWMRLAAW
jgi:hypothetical protein